MKDKLVGLELVSVLNVSHVKGRHLKSQTLNSNSRVSGLNRSHTGGMSRGYGPRNTTLKPFRLGSRLGLKDVNGLPGLGWRGLTEANYKNAAQTPKDPSNSGF